MFIIFQLLFAALFAYIFGMMFYYRVIMRYITRRDFFNHPNVGYPVTKYSFPLQFLFGDLVAIIRELPGKPHERFIAEARSNNKDTKVVVMEGFLGRPRVTLASADIAHEMMTRDLYVKPEFAQRSLRRIVGVGLLTSEFEEHRSQRSLINPSFAAAKVKIMDAVFERKSKELVSWISGKVDENGGKVLINIHELFTRLTLDVIGLVAFGYDFRAIQSEGKEADEMNKHYTNLISGNSISFLLILQNFFPIFRLYKSEANKKQEIAQVAIVKKVKEIINSRRQSLEKVKEEPTDLLGSLLTARDQDGNPIPDQELCDQTLTFLLAGHETSSVALTWAIYLLHQNRHCYEKLLKEIDNYGKYNEFPSSDEKLPYLDMVVKEALRLYPPASVTARSATRDDSLSHIPIPCGIDIVTPIWAFHRDETVWGKNAADFIPERWEKVTNEEHRYYLPFWSGRRSCIGRAMAINEIKAVLFAFVSHFDFSLSPDAVIIPKLTITLRPKNGMPMILSKRERK